MNTGILAFLVGILAFVGREPSGQAGAGDRVSVACYYFGNYHPGDARNAKLKGADWSEWELVKAAKPRFPGHHQPNVPLWGYTDESDPTVMAQKIAAAADHGIDAFIFDWYCYDDGPFLEKPIDRGFLKAANNDRIKFALMWANHDWLEIHPYTKSTPQRLLYPGRVTPESFERISNHIIKDYFLHPSYWKIDGKPYFSFYDLSKLLESFGGVQETRTALDALRAKAVTSGLPGLHLNAVVWGRPILPGEGKPADMVALVRDLGFDSVTSYVWVHYVGLPRQQTDYDEVRDGYVRYWDDARKLFGVPFFPNVTMGWDPSPRCDQRDSFDNSGYPFTNTIGGNTPSRFGAALTMMKDRLLADASGPRVLTINCWNEWTEGSYLEPDTVNGFEYLEAVRDVFGESKSASVRPAPPSDSGTGDGTKVVRATESVRYADNRPSAQYRMDAQDAGVIFRHGAGPKQCDALGARNVWVYESNGSYYMHYDGAGPKGWLACLATSKDMLHWTPKGPVLDFGSPGEDDSASASYGVTYFDGKAWHMFYLGTPHVSPAPDLVPSFPYLTMKARSDSPAGPWTKQKAVIPFRTKPGTYYQETASPGQVIKQGDEYLMFFSASMKRTLGIARTMDLDGPWTIDPAPILPPEEQVENSSLYYEPANQTWFLFTNHVGVERQEYTDAVWVYWTKDLNRWDADHKAVVLDGTNCTWSKKCIGLPSVLKVGNRLAVVYDAPGGESTSHMRRDIGLAWLNLPLRPPAGE